MSSINYEPSRASTRELIAAGSVFLVADMDISPRALGVVLLANDCREIRTCASHQLFAHALRERGFGIVMADLLSGDEVAGSVFTPYVFSNIGLLAARVVTITRWLLGKPAMRGRRLGFLGSNCGGSAVLRAAASLGSAIDAVVCHYDVQPAPPAEDGPGVVWREKSEAGNRTGGSRTLAIVAGNAPTSLASAALKAADWFQAHWRPAGTRPGLAPGRTTHFFPDACPAGAPGDCLPAASLPSFAAVP